MILVSVGFTSGKKDGNPVVAILHVQSQQIFYTSQFGFQDFLLAFLFPEIMISFENPLYIYIYIYLYMFQTLK